MQELKPWASASMIVAGAIALVVLIGCRKDEEPPVTIKNINNGIQQNGTNNTQNNFIGPVTFESNAPPSRQTYYAPNLHRDLKQLVLRLLLKKGMKLQQIGSFAVTAKVADYDQAKWVAVKISTSDIAKGATFYKITLTDSLKREETHFESYHSDEDFLDIRPFFTADPVGRFVLQTVEELEDGFFSVSITPELLGQVESIQLIANTMVVADRNPKEVVWKEDRGVDKHEDYPGYLQSPWYTNTPNRPFSPRPWRINQGVRSAFP